jgi:hypothetical protein
MGSNRWTGAAIGNIPGYFIGRHKEHKDKDRRREWAARHRARANEKESSLGDPAGGEDPFTNDTTEIDKKKKVNTLITGSNVGALSGATTLGS